MHSILTMLQQTKNKCNDLLLSEIDLLKSWTFPLLKLSAVTAWKHEVLNPASEITLVSSLMQLKFPNYCFSAHLCPNKGPQMCLIASQLSTETKTKQPLASYYIKRAGVMQTLFGLPENLILWLFSVKYLEHTSFSPNGFQNSSSFSTYFHNLFL